MIRNATSGRVSVLALIVFGFACPGATADTTIVWNGEGSEQQKMEISNGMIRVLSGDAGVMMYNASSGDLTVVNDDERTYTVITQADIEKMLGAQERLMAQMEQQLAALPPAQREQVQQMMKQRMPAGMGDAPQPRRVNNTGETRQIAGVDCQMTEVFRGSQQVAELCMADHQDLNIDSDDYQTLRSMQEFAMEMASKAAAFGAGGIDFGDMSEGAFPVSYRGMGDAAMAGSNSLDSISDDAIDPAHFQIPSGYREQQLPEMPF